MISETKLDSTFPTNQFFIQEYLNVHGLDRNNKGGGMMLFVKNGIITSKKCLIFCIYTPRNRFIKDHLKEMGKAIEFYSKKYENIIIMGSFNAEISEHLSVVSLTVKV